MDADCGGSCQAKATSPVDKGRFILRQLNIRNFIKFKSEQELKFENNGAYFLIGQNQSGKSSVFEAIRRCMSLRYNSSLSSVPNHAEDSIVVCRFESDRGSLFSFSIYKAKSNPDDETVCLKGCVLLNESKEVALDIVKYNTGELVSSQLSPNSNFDDFPKTFKLDAFRDWVEASASELPVDIGRKKDVDSRCEKLLETYLDGIVSTFPMRGIGPLQWSRSSKIEKKSENYIEASQRAEVIGWYLERCNKKQSGNEKQNVELYYNFITDGRGGQYRLQPINRIPKEDEATCNRDYALKCKGKQPGNEEINEEKYYNFITNTKGVKYRLLKTDQIPKDVATSNTDLTDIIVETGVGGKWPILKQSEGFLEAKLCSILLAVEDFSTVLLEDPGTGMHPQMMGRLCITMTERVHDKVVIVSTHNSTFLKPWLIENIFYFSRSDDAGSFDISSGKYLAERRKLMSAIPGKVTSEQFANFCYAETIFFVKNVEDQLSWEKLARDIQKTDSGNSMSISGVQFVSIHGKGKRIHFEECCKMLKKKYEFVLDITNEDEKRNKLKKTLGLGMEAKSSGSRQTEATPQYDKGRYILRQINIRNFVKFLEEQELKFENNGVYFFIGQNQSGKSSVFEAIRRCMSLRYNSSLSSAPNHAEDSIVVCRFENDTGAIFSFSIYKAKSNPDDETVCLKGCVLLNESKEVALDIVKYNTGELVSSQLSPNSNFDDFPKTFNLDAFRDWVEASVSELPVDIERKKDVDSRCEKLLETYLDGIVSTFPMRGIGPLQWSRSSRIEKKSENYTEASQRAEVIGWYLERCNKKHPEENEERKKQDCYRTAGKTSEIVFENDGKQLPILKQSEGCLEAKLCSILLAVEDFATVLLEDPGTGMHPQMIDRLCITMTERVHDKVVIVSTHNSNFLKPENIENIFHFKSHGETFEITPGKVIKENVNLKLATRDIIYREQFGNFCYAETIVVLEGPSDELFMEALVRVMRKAGHSTRMLFSGFQFVSMGGIGKVPHFRNCCKIFASNYAFVLDRDKGEIVERVIQNAICGGQKQNEAPGQKNTSINSEKEGELKIGIENKTENATELEELYKHKDARSRKVMPNPSNEENDVEKQAEERNKFFIWKCEDLEDVFFGILKDLKDKKVNLNQTIHDILEKCVKNDERKLIDFQGNGGDSYIIKNVEPRPRHFKLFLNGDENFEDRVTLFDFLLNTFEPRWKTMDVNESADTDPNETEETIKGSEDLIRIHNFLRILDIQTRAKHLELAKKQESLMQRPMKTQDM